MATVYEGILDMVSFILGMFFSAVFAQQQAAVFDTFYPPLNHTTFISNASLATYGGIYSAPSDRASPDAAQDVYNYCSMPHPHVDSYSVPTTPARLVYLEYLQRHQRRTPYNILPGGENQQYNCDNIHPHVYASQSALSEDSMRVYGQTYSDPLNPFLSAYVNGSCQYPQLTLGGLLDGYQHGRDLQAVYGRKLGLIPSTLEGNEKRVWFRSSSSALTQGSASGVLRGIWPDHRGSVPLHQQASSIDTVDRGFPCAARDSLLSAIQSTAEWKEHLQVTQQLRDRLATMFGAEDSPSWLSTFDHFADNFQARLCNGYELPCSLDDESACATTEQANKVFRAGDWEWNYWWRRNANATRYIQLVEGLFIGEMVRKWEAVARQQSELVYSHNFVHDGDIGPILGALGIQALRWPGMGSNIAFEIWETSESQFYARVLYSGHAIKTIHGTLDWIPLATLIDILRPFIPEDIVAMCNSD